MFVLVLGREPPDRERVTTQPVGPSGGGVAVGAGRSTARTIVIEAAEPGRSTRQADEPGVAEPDADTDRVIQGWRHARHRNEVRSGPALAYHL